MIGAFSCCPVLCSPCSRAAVEIQRTKHHAAWGEAVQVIADDKQRECVREYLRGIYQRAREARQAKREAA